MSADLAVSLSELAAQEPPVICDYCREPVVHDGDIWRHVRTGLSAQYRKQECRPLCKTCGAPAKFAIGGDVWTGAGSRYQVHHFLCATCPREGTGIVEYVR